MEIIDKFFEWIKLKMKLDSGTHKPPLVHERDIWWISFGKNVGSEINGKSELYSRPGLVLKKLSSGLYLVAPTTSKSKMGNWYIEIQISGKTKTYICLHQIRIIDYRRLWSKIGQIDSAKFLQVKERFHNLYK